MAVTLLADVGGEHSNSYLTVAEAQAYLDGERLDDPPPAWTGASASLQAKALISATREIDAHTQGVKFHSRRNAYRIFLNPLAPTQRLRFPRMQDLDDFGRPIVPPGLKQACAELALYLIARPAEDDQRRNLQAQGVQHLSVGKVSETYRPGAGRSIIDYCPAAAELLRPFGYGAPLRMG